MSKFDWRSLIKSERQNNKKTKSVEMSKQANQLGYKSKKWNTQTKKRYKFYEHKDI